MKMRWRSIIVAIALSLVVRGVSAESLYSVDVIPGSWSNVDFKDLHLAGSQAWAVGESGTIIHSNDGFDWHSQTSGVLTHLNAVYFDETGRVGWVVGNDGVILKTEDSGISWYPLQSRTLLNLYDVHFVNRNLGWAVGELGIIIHTGDGGNTWTKQESNPPNIYEDLHGVHAHSQVLGWAVGDNGTILRWNGLRWEKQRTVTRSNLYGIYFVSLSTGWAVGEGGIILRCSFSSTPRPGTVSEYDWSVLGKLTSSDLRSIHFPVKQYGWIVGDRGTILYTESYGTFVNYWKVQSWPSSTDLNAVYAMDANYIWAVGDNGKILRIRGRTVFQTEVKPISPSGYISDASPLFQWDCTNKDIESIEYTLFIDDDNTPYDGASIFMGNKLSYKLPSSAPLPEGKHSWGVRTSGFDSVDSPSMIFTVDLSEPTGTVKINDGAEFTNSLTVDLTLSASDPLSAPGEGPGSGVEEMQFSNDGQTWSAPESYATTKTWDLSQYGGNSQDGAKTVYARFTDKLGHLMTTPAVDEIILDTKPPTGNILVNDGAEFTGPIDITLTLQASDSLSGMEPGGQMTLSNDGSTWSPPIPYRTSMKWGFKVYGGNENEEVKTVYVKFMDAVGNWTPQPATDTIELDTTGPEGSIIINDGEELTNLLIVKLTLSASDQTGLDWMRFSNDNKTWSPRESYNTMRENWDLSQYGGDLKDGTKTVYVRFVDGVGNATDPSISAQITVKSQVSAAAQIFAPLIPGKIKSKDLVQVDGIADPGGSLVYRELLDEKDMPLGVDLAGVVYEPATGRITGSFNVGELTAESIRLKLAVEDQLHNRADITSNQLTVDNEPPGNANMRIEQGEFTNSAYIRLAMSATDAVETYVDGDVEDQKAWVVYADSMRIGLTEGDGIKVVKVKFRDDIGNESVEISDRTILDTKPPAGEILINNGDEITKIFLVTLTISASDENGIESYTLSNDGSTWTLPVSFTGKLNIDGWDLRQHGGNRDEGIRPVYVKYKDKVGNVSDLISDDIEVNATPPTISVQIVKDKQEAMEPVTIVAIIKSGRRPITETNFYYRGKGTSDYTKLRMAKLQGDYYKAEIPASEVTFAGVEYYLSVSDSLWTVTHPPKDAPVSPNSFTVVDTKSPVIEHDPVESVPVESSPKITARVTDTVGVKQVSLLYKLSSDKNYKRVDMVAEAAADVYSAGIPALDSSGEVNYYIEALDTSSNSATAPLGGVRQPYVISFVDTEPPAIAHTKIPDNQEAGNPVLIGASITDNAAIEKALLKYRAADKIEFVEVEMTSIGSYYSAEIPGNIVMPGSIEYAIVASDGSPQSDDVDVSHSFTVVDTTPPDIDITSMPSRVEVHNDISIEAKVTDNVMVKSVRLYYMGVEDTKFNVVNMPGVGTRHAVSLPAQPRAGEVKLYIYAEDSGGLSATEPSVDPQNAPRVITIFDTSSPVVQHSPVLGVQEAGNPVTVTATVTDDVEVAEVSLHYRTAGDDAFKLMSMLETGAGIYEGNIPASTVILPGVEYYIKAVDDSSNVTTHPAINPDTLPHSFSAKDTAPPEIIYDPSGLETVLINEPIVVVSKVTDLTGVREVKVFHRSDGESSFNSLICEGIGDDRYSAALPSPSSEGTIYYYIQAEDNSGNEAISPEGDPIDQPYSILVDDPYPPLQPDRLVANAASGGVIMLTWQLSESPDTVKYNIYTDNGSGTVDYSNVYDSVDSRTDKWESPALGEGVYKFVVRAVDGSGNEEDNTESVSAGADATKPQPATNLVAESLPGGHISLKWKLSTSSDAAVYNIYWDNGQIDIDYSLSLARVNDPGTSYETNQLKDGIYRFVIRCQDHAGNEEENTSFIGARADSTPPRNVTGLLSTTHSVGEWSNQTRVTAKWNPAEDDGAGLAGYSLIWDTSQRTMPDELREIGNEVNSTVALPGNISAGQYFHIRPVDVADNWSSEASHLGPFFIDTQLPQPPTALKASPQADGKVKLDWGASPSGDVVNYNIYWDNGTGRIDYSTPLETVATLTWTSSALGDGKTYQFSVRAEDRAGNEEENSQESSSIADGQPPSIVHEPVLGLLEQEVADVPIEAIVTDASGLDNVELHYRKLGTTSYTNVDMVKRPGDKYESEIPSSALLPAGVDYYISAIDAAGNTSTHPVFTITVSETLKIPIDASKENEIVMGSGSSAYFPVGAIDTDTYLNVTALKFIPEPQAGLGKHIFTREFSLDAELKRAIRLTLRYGDEKVAGEDESRLALYLWDGERWNYVSSVIPQANSATGTTTELGIFSIIGDYDPPSITDLPPPGYIEPKPNITVRLGDSGSGIDQGSIDVKLVNKETSVAWTVDLNVLPETVGTWHAVSLSIDLPTELERGSYSLQIAVSDNVGNQKVATSEFQIAGELTLKNVFCAPNPFQPSRGVNFLYTLTESVSKVTIRIFGMGGKMVREIEGSTSFGENVASWDCEDEAGKLVLNSVYICHIEAEGSQKTVTETIKIAGWE